MSDDIPDWLNEELIHACVQSDNKNKLIVIKKMNVELVVPPGNNYGGYLRRIVLEYQEGDFEDTHNLSVIVKGLSTALKNVFDQFSHTEPTFYYTFLPEMYNISPTVDITPKPYFSRAPHVIIIEDLKTSGYLMADRCKLLDFDHCQLYVIAAATFHAVSVAVHKKRPMLVESLGVEKIFSNELESALPVKRFYMVGIRFFADKIDCINEYKKYSNILRNSSNIVWDLTVEALKCNSNLNTLHQGDPWTTNMMFKYDSSGKVTCIKLLDFQQLRYSSPVNDLIFFLWTSATNDVRESKLEDLYHFYCKTLNEKLEEFGCSERLSYTQLLENVKLLNPMVLMLCASCLPILIGKSLVGAEEIWSKSSDENKIINFFDKYYDEKYCETQLPRVLKQLEQVGVFDYFESYFSQNKNKNF